MCAAPGSKTTQLLEIITNYANDKSNNNINNNKPTPGFIIANDSNVDRAYMLVHQCRRLNSPYLMITTHMAQQVKKKFFCLYFFILIK